jgi:hypothetical protein
MSVKQPENDRISGDIRFPYHLLGFFGGVLVGAFLVVQDEILTLALYCGRQCGYPYPLIGTYSLYDAESIAFVVVLVGMGLALVSSRGRTRVRVDITVPPEDKHRDRVVGC